MRLFNKDIKSNSNVLLPLNAVMMAKDFKVNCEHFHGLNVTQSQLINPGSFAVEDFIVYPSVLFLT